ncbi:hypothetical protein GGQ04_003341 [Salinibacter ruber]|uniref:CHC2 zinc finger domain-containing protein n=1 Tax=Salinibacter ruber TaxID=146919 RepID=UPI002168ABA0|nr:CHC2 zinc finger domain-containing protein [Salinibacter ruber]MCS4048182.1 hypothetical protein [Salinibacter ruber]
MNTRTENLQFSDVKRRLQPGDVFQSADHEWKTQSDRRWKGSCPWHDSSSGTCFTVNPETLEWKCFSCDRGGGPLQYVAELENVGSGAHGSLKGQDFFKAWEALSRHAGCKGPPDSDSGTGRNSRPAKRKGRKRRKAPQRVESASTTSKGSPSLSDDTGPRAESSELALDTPESELRKALSRYRKALKESEKARRYVEGRGLSVETLHAYGCGFAPAGQWIGSDNAPRLVTPHTAPTGDGSRLVNLSGRYLGTCPKEKRHRHIGGNPTALFNAAAIEGESTGSGGPLVICEGPLDALSFIEAGHARTVALHNTKGVPWTALRGSASALVFAFDADDTGTENAVERAREAVLRGHEAHVLPDGEGTYGGHSDPNEALQAGELSLAYLEEIGTDSAENPMEGDDLKQPHGAGDGTDSGRAGSNPENNPMTDGANGAVPAGKEDENTVSAGTAESRETAANGSGEEAGQSPTPEAKGKEDGAQEHTAADLVPYWNGSDIGHLGRWLWERGGVPDGPVGPSDCGGGVYADRELHEWVEEGLQAGPDKTTGTERDRLRRVLWRLYATHGPEDVPEEVVGYLATPDAEPGTAGDSPPRAADVWEERPRDPYRLGRLPDTVETTRTDAPTDNPHPGKRGIAIDSPYSEGFVHDLKVLPEWARTWNGEAWVVDDCFAAFAGDLCRHYFGR